MGQIQIGAGDDGSGWNGGMAFPYAVEGRRAPTRTLKGSQRRRPNRPGFSSVLRRYRLSRFL